MDKPLTRQTVYVLLALMREDTYAYGVYKYIVDMTSYLVLPAPNVVKRILDRAVKDEWVSTYGRDDKTLYHLEEEGYNRLRSEIYAWQRTVKVWEKEDKSR